MTISIDQFRFYAVPRFHFLEALGFHRVPNEEVTTATTATVVYLGENVGFIFSFDFRDQCVDGVVTQVRNGKVNGNSEGGRSLNLFSYLVKYAGYRGKGISTGTNQTKKLSHADVETMIDGWAELLLEAGQSLLKDTRDSFPARA